MLTWRKLSPHYRTESMSAFVPAIWAEVGCLLSTGQLSGGYARAVAKRLALEVDAEIMGQSIEQSARDWEEMQERDIWRED